ncbi:MAG: ABC transporter substrate-binding protein [Methylobacteriaceae bacterium]|nr:ABC transporter substrate-binding protein [Methylobacteriaceae bacterium]
MKRSEKLAYLSLASVLCALAGAGAASAADKYVVGVSNTLIGNGWREEMICSIKAQAEASGIVSKVVVANRNGGPAEQIADLRNLISAGVNAIIVNPSDREALNPVIKQAATKGIVVVAVDQAVSAPEAYVLTNDQVAYGKVGATWLFEHLKGKGNVVEMRGIDGVPADADRHQGFTEALKNYPDIKVVASTFTGWALNKGAQQMKDLLASGKEIDGVWTSGIDSVVVDAFKTAQKSYVPVVGADNNGFVGQLINLKGEGFSGAAVTNPPSVGGAGLAVALDVLQKKDHPHLIKITPEVWDNTTDANLENLKKVYDAKLDPFYSIDFEVKPYTTYTMPQILACKGP